MEQELLPIFFTVIISAVMQVDLISTFAVVELTYKLLWLVLWFLRMICKSRQKNAHPTLTMQIHEVLRQRIVINYNMQGLSGEEVSDYVKDRMKQCGVTQEVFDGAALEAACGCCGGSIRRLNSLMHKALMIGCEQKLRVISPETVMDAANEIDLV